MTANGDARDARDGPRGRDDGPAALRLDDRLLLYDPERPQSWLRSDGAVTLDEMT